MTYDLTLLNNVTNPVQYVIVINTMSNYLFGGMLIILIYFLFFLTARQEYFPNLLLAVSLFMSGVTAVLLSLGWVPSWYLGMNIVVLIAAIIIKVWTRKQ